MSFEAIYTVRYPDDNLEAIPNPQPNNLHQITTGKGYWIEALEPASLTISGYQPFDYQTRLFAGWNYIGYPSLIARNISNALASLGINYNKVYSYNAEQEKWEVYNLYQTPLEPNTITEIVPGKGYLIDLNSNAVWYP